MFTLYRMEKKNRFQLYTYAYMIQFEGSLVHKSYISFIT